MPEFITVQCTKCGDIYEMGVQELSDYFTDGAAPMCCGRTMKVLDGQDFDEVPEVTEIYDTTWTKKTWTLEKAEEASMYGFDTVLKNGEVYINNECICCKEYHHEPIATAFGKLCCDECIKEMENDNA